jgi:hypothetical protein
MDPYLEAGQHWPVFQRGLVAGLSEVLQPSLAERYRIRAATRRYVHELVLFTSVQREEHEEEYLEIRQRSTDRLVTVVDIVSPHNRTTSKGRQEYQRSQQEFRRQGANVVELDLVLQGTSCLDIATEGLPPFHYAVCVCRARHQDRLEIYTTTLRKRLPRIRLPLASDDRDLVVDLQAVFSRCYDRHFDGRVDYSKDPPALLDEDDARWLRNLLAAYRSP